jgi:nitronate monooxygenase
MTQIQTAFTRDVNVQYPILCGAMYPCSNPELVAAASEAGGIGIIQPLSLIYVHGYELRSGIRKIRELTKKPVGFNAIVEKSSKAYETKMRAWVDMAIEEGIRFAITALGNPKWVVDKFHAAGGIVYHDVTTRGWAQKALDAGVDGFICVNNRAGGHAGEFSAERLYEDLKSLGKPLICAGGVSTREEFLRMLELGYSAVQMGTRFIATHECTAHSDYKRAIVAAEESDIVLTEKISGVPVAVIRTPYIEKIGTHAGFIAKRLLRGRKTKHWMRLIYTLQSLIQLKKASLQGAGYKDYWQAGKSVANIRSVQSVREVIEGFVQGTGPRTGLPK